MRHYLGIIRLEGNIKEAIGDYPAAEKRYSEAHGGFVKREYWHRGALAAVDLAIAYARQNKNEQLLELGSELVPNLEKLELYPETLAAVRLLAKAVAETKITSELLCGVREKLRKDPLIQLALGKRGPGEPPGS